MFGLDGSFRTGVRVRLKQQCPETEYLAQQVIVLNSNLKTPLFNSQAQPQSFLTNFNFFRFLCCFTPTAKEQAPRADKAIST